MHRHVLTYRSPAAVARHPRPRPPAQLPPLPPRKRRDPALPGDRAHRFRVLSAVSGSARLFPDQPCRRLRLEVGEELPSVGRRDPWGRRAAVPGPAPLRLPSWGALFEDTSSSKPQVLFTQSFLGSPCDLGSSVQITPPRRCPPASAEGGRSSRGLPSPEPAPGGAPAALPPGPGSRYSDCGQASCTPALVGVPRGRAGSAPLFWAPESPRRQSVV